MPIRRKILDELTTTVRAMLARELPEREQGHRIRDQASIEQLLVLTNLESMNAEFIYMGLLQGERLQQPLIPNTVLPRLTNRTINGDRTCVLQTKTS